MPERVLVTGGTGKTGALVAAALAARGITARIATRNPVTPSQIRFDWHDRTTHEAALEDVDAVYLVAPTDRTDQLSSMMGLLEHAAARTMPMVLLSASSIGQGYPMMGEVHAWLSAHASRWTVLRPSWFMQNFVTQHLASIVEEGQIYSAAGDGRVPFIDATDIAAVAAEALTEPGFPNGELVLTGRRAFSYDEAARLISDVAGHPVRHVRLSTKDLAGRYAGFGLPADYAALLARMDEAVGRGAEDRTTDLVEQITGRPPNGFHAFLEGNRPLLRR